MPAGAIALALAAAFAHAIWNLLVAGAGDPSAATAVAVWAGVLAFAPVALITGGVHTAALPYVAASGALHLVYMGLLAASCGRAELSLVYPLSRLGARARARRRRGLRHGAERRPGRRRAGGGGRDPDGARLRAPARHPRPGLRGRSGGVHRGLHAGGQGGRVARLADRLPGAGAADRRARLPPGGRASWSPASACSAPTPWCWRR